MNIMTCGEYFARDKIGSHKFRKIYTFLLTDSFDTLSVNKVTIQIYARLIEIKLVQH